MAVTQTEKDYLGTLDDLCMWLAMSKNTAKEYVANGTFVRVGDVGSGQFRLVKSVNNYVERQRAAASGRGTKIEGSRARLAEAQALLAEKKAGALAGELVVMRDIEIQWASVLRWLRAALLAIPSRVAGRVPGVALMIVDAVDREIRDILTELADNAQTVADDVEARLTASAAAKSSHGGRRRRSPRR